MKLRQLLLLVQSQADVDALPAAADAYNTLGFNALWVLFSPVVLVDTKAVSAEYDGNIAGLRAQIQACKDADDFDGAKGYKGQLDDAIMQKTIKVKEAWRTLTQEQQAAAQDRVFGPFFAKLPKERIRIESLREHFEPTFFIDALASVKKAWFVPFTPGSFAMDWAANLAAAVVKEASPDPKVSPPAALPPVPAPPTPKPEPKKSGGNPMFTDPRYRELTRFPIDELGRIMTKHRLILSGSASKIAAGIWKHEQFLKTQAQ